MIKYLKVIIKILPILLYDYFARLIKYSRHPEKYPLEVRFRRIQTLIIKVLNAFNVKVENFNIEEFYENYNPDKSNLYVANHISDLDPLIFVALSKKPLTFVGKIEIRKYPMVNRVIRALEGEFLDRNDLKQSLRVFKSIEKKMNEKPNLDWLIFPEGTRNRVNPSDTKEFHYGTFKAAMNSKSDINVFSLLGSHRVLDIKCKFKTYPVSLKFNHCYKYEEYSTKKTVELSSEAYKVCRSGVESLVPEDKKLVEKYNKN